MKKTITRAVTLTLLVTMLVGTGVSAYSPDDIEEVTIKIINVPEKLEYGQTLSLRAYIENIPYEAIASTQWVMDGAPIEGWYNSSFLLRKGASSDFEFQVPFYHGMPDGASFGFDFAVNGILKRTEVYVPFQEYPAQFYLSQPSEDVFNRVTPVLIDASPTSATKIYSDRHLTKPIGTIEAGVGVKYIDQYVRSSALIQLANGSRAWVPYKILKISATNYTVNTDHSKDDKEGFVNLKGFSSSTPYLVWINPQRQKVNVFLGSKNGWGLIKEFPCATGANPTPTPVGSYKYTATSPRWSFDGYYVKNIMYFEVNRGFAFHTRIYANNGRLLDGTIGTPASNGCVRMLDEDIAWMMYYVPFGTTVEVF